MFVLFQAAAGLASGLSIITREKERRTFEPLLALPVRSLDICVAKFVTTSLVSVAGVAAFMVAVAGIVAPIGRRFLDFDYRIEPMTLLSLLVVGVLASCLFAAAGVLAGASARTEAEATWIASVLNIGVTAAGMAVLVAPDLLPAGAFAPLVPVLGAIRVMRDAVTGEPAIQPVVLAALPMLAATVPLLRVAGRRLCNDRAVLRIS